MIRRHPRATLLAALLALAAAVPVTAYVIVPQFVRSTLSEPLPTAAPAAAATDPGSTRRPAIAPIIEPDPQTLRQGALVRINAADYGSGTVRVVRVGSERFLRFEGVDIAAAPDMYVYLSDATDGRPGRFVDLGKLKATNGSFNYAVPESVDLATVRTVVVWCRQFSVTVTYALLA